MNTTGLWTSTGGTPPDAFRIEWANAESLDGPVGLLRASKNDRAYWAFDQDQGEYTATLEWDLSDGSADGSRVDLMKVVAVGADTSIALVARWHTRRTQIQIDPGLIDPLGTYVVLMDVESGRPNGTEESTISYPFAYSYVMSASFRVP